jgi:hypothetical protein
MDWKAESGNFKLFWTPALAGVTPEGQVRKKLHMQGAQSRLGGTEEWGVLVEYAAMTKDAAQSRFERDRWTFYEAVNLDDLVKSRELANFEKSSSTISNT